MLATGIISGRIGCGRRRPKLRRHIAVEYRRADMIETTLEITPDLAADIRPALAEREVLAEIGAGRRIDHAFKQREAVAAAGEIVMRMFAEELQRWIGRAHLLENVTPNHQESGSGVAYARKAVHDGNMIGIFQLEHIVQCGRRNVGPLAL